MSPYSVGDRGQTKIVEAKYFFLEKNESRGVDNSFTFAIMGLMDNISDKFYFQNKKFDVIFAGPTLVNKNKTKPLWDFDLRGRREDCDFLLLIGVNHTHPEVVFLIPLPSPIPARHIRISIDGDSKWHRFKVWDKNQL